MFIVTEVNSTVKGLHQGDSSWECQVRTFSVVQPKKIMRNIKSWSLNMCETLGVLGLWRVSQLVICNIGVNRRTRRSYINLQHNQHTKLRSPLHPDHYRFVSAHLIFLRKQKFDWRWRILERCSIQTNRWFEL